VGAGGWTVVEHLTLNCRTFMAYATPQVRAARKRRHVGLSPLPDTPSSPANTRHAIGRAKAFPVAHVQGRPSPTCNQLQTPMTGIRLS
jgi:hypothetical protein